MASCAMNACNTGARRSKAAPCTFRHACDVAMCGAVKVPSSTDSYFVRYQEGPFVPTQYMQVCRPGRLLA